MAVFARPDWATASPDPVERREGRLPPAANIIRAIERLKAVSPQAASKRRERAFAAVNR
jgi:hypothetical protein